mgnify:CR=1 FL=1
MGYFFDTYALIEIIKDNENYNQYGKEEIITSILNMGELYYSLLRNFNKQIAEEWEEKLIGCYLIVTEETIVKAMKFRFEHKDKNFSFIDCVGYILAKENNLKFLTGDKEFKEMENVEFVK